MTAACRFYFTLMLSACLLPWCSPSAQGTRAERVFSQLKALRECEQRAFYDSRNKNDTAGCDWRFDGWHCWPPTARGVVARAPCPVLLPGVVNSSVPNFANR
ncbi:uncharacterized protein LOC125943507 [Dermacentor silvarum]|uniref:uncharacterized protein LOC125943507 n=1 Tax=Dermacentor silvarum TaxID=543639 RepID=UPI0021007261|nr:uncharacterized protein LOC125943507 [Dermacentor silvarum]